MMQPLNFLLAGVGGQGTILASGVLAQVGLAAGYDVKQAEVHGMSQRGGSVTSYVRWGDVVHAPLVGPGEVDVFVAFEKLEALRYLSQLRHDALAIINAEQIVPVTVSSLGQRYPDDETLRAAVARTTSRAVYVDGPSIARSLHEPKVGNAALLGAVSVLLQDRHTSGAELPTDLWLEALTQRVPERFGALNHEAFLAGRAVALAPA
jgi:indolepyruvate ferredoxin oxidoreductase, beta subunit